MVPKMMNASSEDDTPGRKRALSWRARAALRSGPEESVSLDVLACQATWQIMLVMLKRL